MLAAGRSRPWPQILHELTGQRELKADAIIEYFSPLQSWLYRYRQRLHYPLGWKKPLNPSDSTTSGVRKSLTSVKLSAPQNVTTGTPSNATNNHTAKSGKVPDVSFHDAKIKTDAINLKKPNLMAALAAHAAIYGTEQLKKTRDQASRF